MIKNSKKIDDKDNFFGLSLFSKTQEELLISLVDHLKSGKNLKIVFTPNPEQVVLAQEQPEFQQLLQQADFLLPDGIGLVWATRLLARKNQSQAHGVAQRITGVDVVTQLLSETQKLGQKVLVVGGREYYQLPAHVSWTPGYDNVAQPSVSEELALAKLIQSSKFDLVLVALGAPQQENWVWHHRELLEKSGVKVVMVIGGAFDVLLGKVKRAPNWLRALGLEWFYRLLQEPWRWRRQLRLVTFLKLTLLELQK